MIGRSPRRAMIARSWSLSLAAGLMAAATAATVAGAQADANTDPRVGLKAGWKDAGEAARGMTLIGHGQKPDGFYNPDNLGDFGYLESDLAFDGHYVFQGNFHGLQIWDVSDPTHPVLRTTMVCPGGQGDPSIKAHHHRARKAPTGDGLVH